MYSIETFLMRKVFRELLYDFINQVRDLAQEEFIIENWIERQFNSISFISNQLSNSKILEILQSGILLETITPSDAIQMITDINNLGSVLLWLKTLT